MKKNIVSVILIIISLVLIFILYKQYRVENDIVSPVPSSSNIVQTEVIDVQKQDSNNVSTQEEPKPIQTVILTGNIIKNGNDYELMGMKLNTSKDLSLYLGKWISITGTIEKNTLKIQDIIEPNPETIKMNNPTVEGKLKKNLQGEFYIDKYQIKSSEDLSKYIDKEIRITTKRLPDTSDGKEVVELKTIEEIK